MMQKGKTVTWKALCHMNIRTEQYDPLQQSVSMWHIFKWCSTPGTNMLFSNFT